jgi:uncharacterized protein (TIGR03083 family)
MEIAPRYDTQVITVDGAPDDVGAAFVRQRRRLEQALSTLTDEQWRTPSRCDGWTAQDVAAHLVGTNGFWSLSIAEGLKGSPTQYLGRGFDPKATPASMVDGMRALSPAETMAQLAESNRVLCEAVEALDDAGWSALAETPPGHLPIRLLAHHGLWDGWVHERDVLLPLGITPDEEPDEILASLRYAAALGPALAGTDRSGALVLEVTDPDARIVVRVDDGYVHVGSGDDPGDVVHSGRAVDVLEIVSVRAPLTQPVPDDARWLVGGLAEVFEVA